MTLQGMCMQHLLNAALQAIGKTMADVGLGNPLPLEKMGNFPAFIPSFLKEFGIKAKDNYPPEAILAYCR